MMRKARSARGFAGWVTLPLLALALAGSVPARSQAAPAAAEPPAAGEVKTIKMIATNWEWKPNVIRVTQGTRLHIEFESFDASHSFVLKAYGIKVQLPEGKKDEVEFLADKAGEFKWRCGRPCGNGCPKMVGKLIVEARE